MRSGDGGRPLIRSLFTLTLLFAPLLCDEYLIGYRAVVKNAELIDERISVAHTMRPCRGTPTRSITLSVNDDAKIVDILKNNFEEFFDFIAKESLHVRDFSKTSAAINTSTTTLTLPIRCFKVDFKGNLAKITAIKE